MKKHLLMALGLLLTVLAQAQTMAVVDGINYRFESGMATVVALPATKYTGDVVIPDMVNYEGPSYPVAAIGANAFKGCKNLTSVTLPNSILNIDASAFENCTKLTSINMPPMLESIGVQAFCDCSVLQQFALPTANLKAIGSGAFIGCNAFTSMEIPEGVVFGGDLFARCKGLKKVVLPASTTDLNGTFFNCDGLETIVCKAKTVPTLNSDAFYNVPSSVKVLVSKDAEAAYKAADGWKSFSVASRTVEEIGDLAYAIYVVDGEASVYGQSEEAELAEVSNVVVPAEVEFEGTTFPVTEVIGSAFYQNKLITDVYLAEGVKTIGAWAFFQCTNLKSMYLPSSLKSIGDHAMRSLTKLETVVCDAYNPPAVESRTFESSKEADLYVIVPINYQSDAAWSAFTKNIKAIPSGEVDAVIDGINYHLNISAKTAEVRALPSPDRYTGNLVIPAEVSYLYKKYAVTSIGKDAFGYCQELTSLSIPASVTNIDNEAIHNNASLASYTVDAANTAYCSVDGVLFTKDMKTLFRFPQGSPLTEYVIPEGVETILSDAFRYDEVLAKVELPASLTSIQMTAFAVCKALETIISHAQTAPSVSVYAFYNVPSTSKVYIPVGSLASYQAANNWKDLNLIAEEDLKIGVLNYRLNEKTHTATVLSYAGGSGIFSGNVVIPADVTYKGAKYVVKTIAENAFYEFTEMTYVILPSTLRTIEGGAFMGSGLKALVLPEGLETIGNAAFARCLSLEVVDLPSTLTLIDNDAFFNCNKLEMIFSRADVPPVLGTADPFSGVSKSIPVYVPDNKETAYNAANGWKSFSNISATRTEIVDGLAFKLHMIAGTAEVGVNSDYEGAQVIIPASVTVPGIDIFPVTSVGDYAFYDNDYIENVLISEGILSLGRYAFRMCSNLKVITLPSSLTTMGDGCLQTLTSLERLICHATVPPVALVEGVFYGTDTKVPVFVPSTETAVYSADSEWSYFKNIFGNATEVEQIIDGINYHINLTDYTAKVIALPSGKYAGEVTVPATIVFQLNNIKVTTIGKEAFLGCDGVTAVDLAEGLETIEEDAFCMCYNAEHIVIPSTVKNIEFRAFAYLYYTKSITCKATTLPTLGSAVFYNTPAEIPLYVPYGSVSTYKAAAQWSDFTNIRDLRTIVNACEFSINGVAPSALPAGTKWTSELSESVVSLILPVDGSAPYRASASMGRLFKKNGDDFEEISPLGEGTLLTAGTYNFKVQIRIDGTNGTKYRFPYADEGTVSVMVQSMPWAVGTLYIDEGNYSYIFATSPEFTISEPAGLETISQEPRAKSQKLIKDGQLFILRDGKLYNASGQEVK